MGGMHFRITEITEVLIFAQSLKQSCIMELGQIRGESGKMI